MRLTNRVLWLLVAGVCSPGWAGPIEAIGPGSASCTAIAGIPVSVPSAELTADFPVIALPGSGETNSRAAPDERLYGEEVEPTGADPILSALDLQEHQNFLFCTTSFQPFAIDIEPAPNHCLSGLSLDDDAAIWVTSDNLSVAEFALSMAEVFETLANPQVRPQDINRWKPPR